MVSPDGVASSQMVVLSASVNLPSHHNVQKYSSGTSLPGWSRKKGRKTVVAWCCDVEQCKSKFNFPHITVRREGKQSNVKTLDDTMTSALWCLCLLS